MTIMRRELARSHATLHRDPDAFRPHMHHWIELARMREDPHPSPIRRVPGLYNLWDHRSEGLATGVEE